MSVFSVDYNSAFLSVLFQRLDEMTDYTYYIDILSSTTFAICSSNNTIDRAFNWKSNTSMMRENCYFTAQKVLRQFWVLFSAMYQLL